MRLSQEVGWGVKRGKDTVMSYCPEGGEIQRRLGSQSHATEAEAIIVEGGYQAVTMGEP